MPVIRYSAAAADGTITRGEVDATSRDAAREALSARGLLALSIEETTTARRPRAMIRLSDLAVGLGALASLLEARIPLARAVDALGLLAPDSWSDGLPRLKAFIQQGHGLGNALQQSELGLSPAVLGIITSAESAGRLAEGTKAAADTLDRQIKLRASLASSLSYPALLLLSSMASIGLLVTVVLPRFQETLESLGEQLPTSTRFVLGAAAVVRQSALPLVLVALALYAGGRLVATDVDAKRRFHALLLRLPGISLYRVASSSARTTAALAALLDSGAPLATALERAIDAISDEEMRARLSAARDGIVEGQSPSTALASSAALSPVALRFVRIGEETGELTGMLRQAATFETNRARQVVDTLVRTLEPVLILLMGSLIALVAASLLQAMYAVRLTT